MNYDRVIPVTGPDLPAVFRNPDGTQSPPRGSADLFLFRAANADAAAAGARRVFEQGYLSDADNAGSVPAWVVAYLGTGPRMSCRLESLEYTASRRRVRLRYASLPPGMAVTADYHVCAALVPLGPVPDGIFTLELYDTRRRQVTLMRRWALRPWGAVAAVLVPGDGRIVLEPRLRRL